MLTTIIEENGKQMLQRVTQELAQGKTVVQWGAPSPRRSVKQDIFARRWKYGLLLTALLVWCVLKWGTPQEHPVALVWLGLYLLVSLLDLGLRRLARLGVLPICKKGFVFPKTHDGVSINTYNYHENFRDYQPPQTHYTWEIDRRRIVLVNANGTEHDCIDLDDRTYQLELVAQNNLVLKPIGAVEGWVLMATWGVDLRAFAKDMAARLGVRLLQY